jgi:hypothetical protein
MNHPLIKKDYIMSLTIKDIKDANKQLLKEIDSATSNNSYAYYVKGTVNSNSVVASILFWIENDYPTVREELKQYNESIEVAQDEYMLTYSE